MKIIMVVFINVKDSFTRVCNIYTMIYIETCVSTPLSLNSLSNMSYTFRSTIDMLTVISERLCLVLDDNGEDRSLALNISKTFDRLWNVCLLHKLNLYGPSNRISNLIQSFSSYPKINIILKCHFLNMSTPTRL